MRKQDKISEAFKHLVDAMMKPYSKTYDDVVKEKDFFLKYSWTEQKQDDFIKYGEEYLRKFLGMSKVTARMEMSWFIMGYGLTTLSQEELKERKKKVSKKVKA